MDIRNSRIIDLPKILDKRGNLSIIEQYKNVPFKIARTYWIYDVPGGEKRGGHAYRENEEFHSIRTKHLFIVNKTQKYILR